MSDMHKVWEEYKRLLDEGGAIPATGAPGWRPPPKTPEEVRVFQKAFAKATGQNSYSDWQSLAGESIYDAAMNKYGNDEELATAVKNAWLNAEVNTGNKYSMAMNYLEVVGISIRDGKDDAWLMGKLNVIMRDRMGAFLQKELEKSENAGDLDLVSGTGNLEGDDLGNLKTALQKTNEGRGPAGGGGKTVDDELSESDLVNLKQCALLSNLSGFAEHYYTMVQANMPGSGFYNGGRVINFMDKDPENMVNKFTSSEWLSVRGMLPTSLINLTSHYFHVFKIDDDGRQTYIPNKIGTGTAEGVGAAAVFSRAGKMGERHDSLNSYISLKSAKVTYEGGTPATNRSDVGVELTYQFKSLAMLDYKHDIPRGAVPNRNNFAEIIGQVMDWDDRSTMTDFRLSDLILLPMGLERSSDDKNAKGIGKIFQRQYDPSYGRIRIKFGSFFNADSLKRGDPSVQQAMQIMKATGLAEFKQYASSHDSLVAFLKAVLYQPCELDLALVDHELKLQEDGNKDHWELTVSYRGFWQSLLTSPLIDAMKSNSDIKDLIKEEARVISDAVAAGCSMNAMHKIYGQFNDYLDQLATRNPQKIIDRLIANNQIYSTSIPKSALRTVLSKTADRGTPLAFPGKKMSAEDAKAQTQRDNIDTAKENLGVGGDSFSQDSDYDPPGSLSKDDVKGGGSVESNYFYLGDLIAAASECIYGYTTGTGEGIDEVDPELLDQELRFVTTPFKHLDSKGLHSIPLSNVPIDLYFYYSWFHETVVKRKRKVYPVAAFIRDLCEVAISNLLAEVCFGPSMESKLSFKTQFLGPCKLWNTSAFHGTGFADGDHYYWPIFEPHKPSGPSGIKPGESPNRLVTNYFIIYSMNQNYFSKTNNGTPQSLIANNIPYVPFGANNYLGYAKKVSLSKTDQPGLRESRFFNTSNNPLTMLSNVYSVSITAREATCGFYPGILFYLDPVDMSNRSGGPNNPASLAYATGIGGYHICTKATISFSNLSDNQITAEETIDGLWVYSGATDELRSMNVGNRTVEQQRETDACRTLMLSRPVERLRGSNELRQQRDAAAQSLDRADDGYIESSYHEGLSTVNAITVAQGEYGEVVGTGIAVMGVPLVIGEIATRAAADEGQFYWDYWTGDD